MLIDTMTFAKAVQVLKVYAVKGIPRVRECVLLPDAIVVVSGGEELQSIYVVTLHKDEVTAVVLTDESIPAVTAMEFYRLYTDSLLGNPTDGIQFNPKF